MRYVILGEPVEKWGIGTGN